MLTPSAHGADVARAGAGQAAVLPPSPEGTSVCSRSTSRPASSAQREGRPLLTNNQAENCNFGARTQGAAAPHARALHLPGSAHLPHQTPWR